MNGADNTVFIVPFSHLDLFWAGTRDECLSRGTRIIRTALDLLEQNPAYRFMLESTSFVEHYLRCFPEEKARMETLVRAGKLEIIPVRSILYTQLPAGETLVRNLLYGKAFCHEKFGVSSRCLSVSDIPGVTPQLPQIAAKSGMTALYLSHGCPPHTDHCIYHAPDGSSVKAYAPLHYAKCREILADGEEFGRMLAGEQEFDAYFGAVPCDQLCQWGADLCVIKENVLENIARWNREGHRKIAYSTFTEFFDSRFPADPKHISGEIPSLWPNVESSWPDLWPLDLSCESAMARAEFFGSLVPEQFDRSLMRKSWHFLLDAMDHNQNGIGGPAADGDKRDLKLAAKAIAEQHAGELARIAAAKATAPVAGAFPIVIFNPLSFRRSELVRGRTALYGEGSARFRETGNAFHLIDAGGKAIPFRLLAHLCGMSESVEVEFFAEDLPAFGAKVYYIVPGEAPVFSSPFVIRDGAGRDRIEPRCAAGNHEFENEFFRLEIDRVTGELTLFDRKAARTLFRRSAILALEETRGDYICNMDLTGRSFPAVAESIRWSEPDAVSLDIFIAGTVYNSKFTQKITLWAGAPTVEIENSIEWKAGSFVRIEQAFPFDSAEEAVIRYGVPFGSVTYPETVYSAGGLAFGELVTPERGSNPDDAITRIRLASKWLSLRDSRGGATVAATGRMWEFDGNCVRNCMVRGTGYSSGANYCLPDGSRAAMARPPAGTYRFRYRITPGEMPRCGWELNAPPVPVGVGVSIPSAAPGLDLPPMPDATSSSVNICNVKPAETEGIVFRCFEENGAESVLHLPEIPGRTWFETNLMEDSPERIPELDITFRPFEIKTFLLK